MSTLQKVLAAALAVAVGAAIFQTYQVLQLRNQAQALQKQHTEQIQQLQGERDLATTQLTALREEVERSSKNAEELLKLRGEVTRLRQQANEAVALRAENSQLRNRAGVRPTEPAAGSAAAVPATNTAASPAAAEDAAKQRNQCITNLRQIGAAMEQSAVANKLTLTSVVTASHILPYLPGNALPVCPAGGSYTFSSLTNNPTCSVSAHNVHW